MKVNLANPWTRFGLSSLAVVVVFSIFYLIYSNYHMYKGPVLLRFNLFEDKKSDLPLYELNQNNCVSLIEAEKKSKEVAEEKTSSNKKSMQNATQPHCMANLQMPDADKIDTNLDVELALVIQRDGKIKRAEVTRASGDAEFNKKFDAAIANNFINNIQFEPCKKNGEAIECRQIVRAKWR